MNHFDREDAMMVMDYDNGMVVMNIAWLVMMG